MNYIYYYYNMYILVMVTSNMPCSFQIIGHYWHVNTAYYICQAVYIIWEVMINRSQAMYKMLLT